MMFRPDYLKEREASPRVSVIIPAHNAERFLEMAIHSVLRQSFEDFEIILIDDASTDRTPELIASFHDPRIRSARNSICQGSNFSRNRAMEMSRGEWIVPLDADDTWHPDRLTRLMETADLYPASFIATESWICFTDPRTEEMIPWRTFAEDRNLRWVKYVTPTAAEFVRYGWDLKPMFPRKVIEANKIEFDLCFAGHDWLAFILHLYSVGLQYVVVNEPMYFYRVGHASISTQHARIVNEIKNCRYLMASEWVDPEARQEIKKLMARSKYRLYISAFKERRWKTGISYLLKYPTSVLYIFKPLLRYVHRRREYKRMIEKKVLSRSTGNT